MRVLLVSHGYPPIGVAGVERLTAQTAAELRDRGHEVAVFTRQPDESPLTISLRREIRDGISVYVAIGGGSTFGLYPGHEATMERIFERLLVELTPDVVLCTHLLHHSPGYVEVAHRWGVPIAIELHDFFMMCPRVHLKRTSGELCDGPEGGRACAVHCYGSQDEAAVRWALRSRAFEDALTAADVVTAPSRYVADAFADARDEARPIRVLENAVARMGPSVRPERPPGHPLRLASIGVTVEHKGFHVVIDAIRQARIPHISYTIFGVALPPQSHRLHAMANRIPGLQFRLANGYEPRFLPVMLAEVDIVLVPSVVAETYSIVTREAFANGVPVIASDIGALPEAIRLEENGWLFAPGDAAALAALLVELDADHDRLKRATEGIRRDDWVTLERRTDQVEALLEEMAERGVATERTRGDQVRLMREALAGDIP
ncbi:MAG: glycosyltransferase [Actinobacteria bacterium]|nr:glycosyltransferase [Actinomycetota bacterium]